MKKKSRPQIEAEPDPFSERCYKLLCTVPRGRITTYKEIALALGTNAYRAVGSAMNKNPNAPQVPCHRVVPSDGTLGKYAFGATKKKRLLESEGISFAGDSILDFKAVLHRFKSKN